MEAGAYREAGGSGLVWGAGWQGSASRAVGLFLLLYLLPGLLLMPDSRALPAFRLVASAVLFLFAAMAIFRFAQARIYASAFEDVEVPVVDEEDADAPEQTAAAAPAQLEPLRLGQAALERVAIALYRFNGLRSEMVAMQGGGYRIRLFARNESAPMGLLLCRAGAAVQEYAVYEQLLRDMEEEGVSKAFFVAPAGFVQQIVALARARHVTLVDEKLLLALVDRTPEHIKAQILAAAH